MLSIPMNEDLPLFSWVINHGLFCLFPCADPEKFAPGRGVVLRRLLSLHGGGGGGGSEAYFWQYYNVI